MSARDVSAQLPSFSQLVARFEHFQLTTMRRLDDLTPSSKLTKEQADAKEQRLRDSVERLWAVYAQRFERGFGDRMAKIADEAMGRVVETLRQRGESLRTARSDISTLAHQLRGHAARLSNLEDKATEAPTAPAVASILESLTQKVATLEENMRLTACASFAEATRKDLDGLRAEVRSSNPQTPGMLQLVPVLYKQLQEHDKRIADLGHKHNRLETALQVKVCAEKYQIKVEAVPPGVKSYPGDNAATAAERWGSERWGEKRFGPKSFLDDAASLWFTRRESFVRGYIQALADSPSLETAKRQLVEKTNTIDIQHREITRLRGLLENYSKSKACEVKR